MKYNRVFLDSIGYQLAPNVVSSAELEARLAPVYETLRIGSGQLEALTGIRERRWWDEGHSNAQGAADAARRALAESKVRPEDIGAIIYAGVCRDHLEPATACAVADSIGVRNAVEVYDISNACLGVLNGILDIANRIELGQIRAGMIVSCETAREINDVMIEKMNAEATMEFFKVSLATLTGGSGAVAVILTDGSFAADQPRLRGAVSHAAPEHHAICRWEAGGRGLNGSAPPHMETDAIAVLNHGVVLGKDTWRSFLDQMDWRGEDIDRVICHQVASSNRESILKAFELDRAKDFSTFEYLGNIGTVSLPMTAAIASERGFLNRGDRVGFLGIGSGLNCMMLGWDW